MYSGELINTIDNLVNAINARKMNVADLPVEYIVRDGNTLILNTRTSQTLRQAEYLKVSGMLSIEQERLCLRNFLRDN